jgi:hypothetical protein
MKIFRSLTSSLLALLVLGFGTARTHAVGAGNNLAELRAALCNQAREYAILSSLHFVAITRGRITVPKSGLPMRAANGWGTIVFSKHVSLKFKSRFEFWGDGTRYRISWKQIGPGDASSGGVEAWDGRQFEVFDPGSGTLWIWKSRPKSYVGIAPPINPILIPLEFAQPPGIDKATPWLHWLTFNRLRHHIGSVLSRCMSISPLPMQADGDYCGRITGASGGMPTRFEVIVSVHKPRLVVAIRTRILHASWPAGTSRITYKSFLVGHRLVWLPHSVRSMNGAISERFKDVKVNERIPPSRFTINYKMARLIVMKPNGKVIHVGMGR